MYLALDSQTKRLAGLLCNNLNHSQLDSLFIIVYNELGSVWQQKNI